MLTDNTFSKMLSGGGMSNMIPVRHQFPTKGLPSDSILKWGLYRSADSKPFTFGQTDYSAFVQRILPLVKLQRQQDERLAAVALDETAQKLLEVVNRETSIRWEDLPEKADADWGEACRAAAILALANLCEASPTRIRLSAYGDKMLAKSVQTD